MTYLWNVFAGFSHLLNAVAGGDPMHSFSARVGHEAERLNRRWARVAENWIDGVLFSPGHCRKHAREEGLL